MHVIGDIVEEQGEVLATQVEHLPKAALEAEPVRIVAEPDVETRAEGVDEAETARFVFNELGQDPGHRVLETRSRNTYENILFSKDLVKPKPGEVWLLATSAMHMPRAMAIARKLNWEMTPWPSDFATAPDSGSNFLDLTANVGLLDYVVHEWIGLTVYRMTGKAA